MIKFFIKHQKITSVILILLSILILVIASKGQTVEEKDGTAGLLLMLVGIGGLIVKE